LQAVAATTSHKEDAASSINKWICGGIADTLYDSPCG